MSLNPNPAAAPAAVPAAGHHGAGAVAAAPSFAPLPAPAVRLQPPDLGRWAAGNTAVPYVHRLEGAGVGPTVLVQALTHGNEICGAIALDALLREIEATGWRPLRGTLVLAFANVEAYARFDAAAPFDSRCVDEDLNRVWADAALDDAARDTVERRRARALRPFVDSADLVLDIHSMSEECPPLMVCGTQDKNVDFARELGVPAVLLQDDGHPAGLRMVERGGFGDPASPMRALLIECGQHWEPLAAEVAHDTLARFLGLVGMADDDWVKAHARLARPPRQRLVRIVETVVARSADFRFLVPPVGLGVVARAGTPVAQDGDHVWTAPCDDTVLVMPGTRNLKPGGTAVRLGRFVD